MKPEGEKLAIVEAARDGGNLVVQAGAGTGKTTALVMIAEDRPTKSGQYVAYNKPIQLDAAEKFAHTNVSARTSHSLAHQAVGREYAHRMRGTKREPSWELAKRLGLRWCNITRDVSVAPHHQARIAGDTLARFYQSDADEIEARHVPFQNGIQGAQHNVLVNAILPIARRWWVDVQDKGGTMPFTHDAYFKMWALTRPTLPYEVIYLDEAQDSNPALAKVISDQAAQLIIVGDSCQQMYAWRGAIDALNNFKDAKQLYLQQSWRFGQAIADEANKWLRQLPTPMELIGHPGMDSKVEPVEAPDAILARTNGGAMSHVLAELDAGRRVALVGGGDALARLARAAADLRAGKKTSHPELFAFKDWEEVKRYANEDPSGKDLLPLVNLVENHGTERILEATNALVSNEDKADVVISTVHKSKGRQWPTVKVAGDFFAPRQEGDELPTISNAEAMVGYVAVTRAKMVLDRSAVAWIDDLVDLPEEEGPAQDGELIEMEPEAG